MLRTKAVKLSVIPAMAFRVKLPGGPSITIQRADHEQPGIASLSKTSGEAIPTANTDRKLFPPEAFAEAVKLTNGLPYKKQKGIKVSKDLFKEEKVPEEVIVDLDEYQKLLDAYSDKKGKLSYDLINKDMIRFAKSSSIVRKLIEEGSTVAKLRSYITSHKIRNITGNPELSDKQVKKMVSLLDEAYVKGVFKDLNEELKRMLAANKKK